MSTPATPLWKPSGARRVLLDQFVPVPRGATSISPAPLNWAAKDPMDVLDYELDISPALVGNDGDSIATLDVAVTPSEPGDLAMHSAYADGKRAIVWLAGGQPGSVYTVTFLISTATGRTLQRSVLLPVLPLSTRPVASAAILTDSTNMLTDQNGNPVQTS